MTYFRKARFSLVELLMAIVVFLILVALLLPSLSRSKITARKVTCISQLRQLVMAAHVYAKDSDKLYPSRIMSNGNPSRYGYPHEMWRRSNGRYNLNPIYLRPYVGENQYLYCPSQKIRDVAYTDDDVQWSTYQYLVWSGSGSAFWRPPRVDLTSTTNIVSPSEAPLWTCKLQNRYGVPKPVHPNTGDELLGHNAAMSDGSASWHDWEELELVWRYGGGAGDRFYWPIYRE